MFFPVLLILQTYSNFLFRVPALGNLVTEIARYMTTTAIDPDVRGHLIEKLSDIEYRLSFGTSEKAPRLCTCRSLCGRREMLRSRKPRA